MARKQNQHDALAAGLRRLRDQGTIEIGQWKEVEKALEKLEHARSIRDWKSHDQAIAKLARIFLK
jgi:hypothetical protein